VPKPKGRKKQTKKDTQSKVPQMPPSGTPPTNKQKIVGGLFLVSAVLGIVLFADWLHDQYGKTFPAVSVKENAASSQRPPAFIVSNLSPYFWMTNIQLICGVDMAAFDVGASGPVGFSVPVTSGISNPPIRPGKSVEYRCDPGDFLKNNNGKITLLGLTTASPLKGVTGSDARLIQAEVWIGVKYRTFWISPEREFNSPKWQYRPDPGSWDEMRPVYR
jgi:hypothetical protein